MLLDEGLAERLVAFCPAELALLTLGGLEVDKGLVFTSIILSPSELSYSWCDKLEGWPDTGGLVCPLLRLPLGTPWLTKCPQFPLDSDENCPDAGVWVFPP